MLLATHVEKLWAVKNRRRAAYFSLAALTKSIDIYSLLHMHPIHAGRTA